MTIDEVKALSKGWANRVHSFIVGQVAILNEDDAILARHILAERLEALAKELRRAGE